MKFLILAALLNNLSIDEVQSIQIEQMGSLQVQNATEGEPSMPLSKQEADKVVQTKYKDFKDDVRAGMKRDNVWTNGTKTKKSEKKSDAKGDGVNTSSEEWTYNMPKQVVDDNMGPTTTRTVAPPMNKIEADPVVANTTKSAKVEKESEADVEKAISELATPKGEEKAKKISEKAGVDVVASEKAKADAIKATKAANENLEKEKVTKESTEAKATNTTKDASKGGEESKSSDASKGGEESKSSDASKGGEESKSSKTGESKQAKAEETKKVQAEEEEKKVVSEKSSAEIVEATDTAAAAKEGPKPKPEEVPKNVKGTTEDTKVEFTPNKPKAPAGMPPGMPTELMGQKSKPKDIALIQESRMLSPHDKTIPKDVAERAITHLLEEPKRIVVL